jgi:hypothetical protein
MIVEPLLPNRVRSAQLTVTDCSGVCAKHQALLTIKTNSEVIVRHKMRKVSAWCRLLWPLADPTLRLSSPRANPIRPYCCPEERPSARSGNSLGCSIVPPSLSFPPSKTWRPMLAVRIAASFPPDPDPITINRVVPQPFASPILFQ